MIGLNRSAPLVQRTLLPLFACLLIFRGVTSAAPPQPGIGLQGTPPPTDGPWGTVPGVRGPGPTVLMLRHDGEGHSRPAGRLLPAEAVQVFTHEGQPRRMHVESEIERFTGVPGTGQVRLSLLPVGPIRF